MKLNQSTERQHLLRIEDERAVHLSYLEEKALLSRLVAHLAHVNRVDPRREHPSSGIACGVLANACDHGLLVGHMLDDFPVGIKDQESAVSAVTEVKQDFEQVAADVVVADDIDDAVAQCLDV